MPISDVQAYQIHIIVFSNLLCGIALFAFSYYVYLKAKKTHLLKCYLCIVCSILLWVISKVFKSVAPTLSLRWFFVVLQYLGVAFLSYALIIFALTYCKRKFPSRKHLLLLGIFPIIFFLIVLTNPLHMKFYSYFDFYRDRFGNLFYPIQVINYTYMLVAVFYLVKGNSQDLAKEKKSLWGKLLATLIIISLSINFYYILFKIDLLSWIFPFPVFDITPIAISFSLFLFMLSVLKFRFFDIKPISYYQSFSQSHLGIAIFDKNFKLFKANDSFYDLQADEFIGSFLKKRPLAHDELIKVEDKYFKVTNTDLGLNTFVLYIEDQSPLHLNHEALKIQSKTLKAFPKTIENLQKGKKALALTKAKSSIAQNMHDILGHSLTVVIGYCEWIIKENSKAKAQDKLLDVKALLMSSLNDLKNAFHVDTETDPEDCIIKKIKQLENDHIQMDLQIQGKVQPLDHQSFECIYRLCQESLTNAIKHGQAKKITIILRFQLSNVEFYIIDDGKGCLNIHKNYGLKGMEDRIKSLHGEVKFGSDGQKGFTIKGRIKI